MSNTGAKSNVKVLSANTIVTTHNKQAEFVVSQQQPIITGTHPAPPTDHHQRPDHQLHRHLQGHRHRREGHAADRRRRQHPARDRPEGRRRRRQRHGRRQRPAHHRPPRGDLVRQRRRRPDDRARRPAADQALAPTATSSASSTRFPIISQLLGGRTHEENRTELLLFVRPHIIPPGETTAGHQHEHRPADQREPGATVSAGSATGSKDSLIKQLTQ